MRALALALALTLALLLTSCTAEPDAAADPAPGPSVGVLAYSFGDYEILSAPTREDVLSGAYALAWRAEHEREKERWASIPGVTILEIDYAKFETEEHYDREGFIWDESKRCGVEHVEWANSEWEEVSHCLYAEHAYEAIPASDWYVKEYGPASLRVHRSWRHMWTEWLK